MTSKFLDVLLQPFSTLLSDPHQKTTQQLADMLTKGKFTRDEWNHLLRLFKIMHLSMFSWSQFAPVYNVEEVDAGKKNQDKNLW